jgi:hypothetical protein
MMHEFIIDLMFCIFKVQHGEQTYVGLVMENDKSHNQLETLEKHYKDSVHSVSDYLANQEDFELIHQRIMQRVHKEELQDFQMKAEEAAEAEKLIKAQRLANDKHLTAKVRFNLENPVS